PAHARPTGVDVDQTGLAVSGEGEGEGGRTQRLGGAFGLGLIDKCHAVSPCTHSVPRGRDGGGQGTSCEEPNIRMGESQIERASPAALPSQRRGARRGETALTVYGHGSRGEVP